MKNNYFKLNDKNFKNNYIKAIELPSDVIQLEYKQKVLNKKRNCLKTILHDIRTSLVSFIIIGTFLYFLIRADEVNSNIPTTLLATLILGTIFYIGASKAITIPKRISNYRNFNFERTCYATITNKYTHTVHSNNRTSYTVCYVDAKINENQYVEKASISFTHYLEAKNGDTIIIVSFDGYKIQAVPININ